MTAKSEVSKRIQELESLIREGRLNRARTLIREINPKGILRDQVLTFANLARRLELTQLSVLILNPIVRPDPNRRKMRGPPATADEKIEYAASLRKLGVLTEAERILLDIDVSSHPKTGFHLALCLITQWRYLPAIPLLEAYIGTFTKSCYELFVGKLNLLQSLIHEEYRKEAYALITELDDEMDRSQFPLLYLKSQELAAQLEIGCGNWERAITLLRRNQDLLAEASGVSASLFTEKWLAIARSLQSRQVLPELTAVRERAIQLNHWETVRDCDFFGARISGDVPALIRLYFGTPHESFRNKILELLPSNAIPLTYHWGMDTDTSDLRAFDLRLGRDALGNRSLPVGSALHRLLIVLSQDFYTPSPLLSIFSKLYSDEVYNPETSPGRVRHTIMRLRKWLDEHSIPVEIQNISGDYRLRFKGPFSFVIPSVPLRLTPRELELMKLRCSIDSTHTYFTTLEAALILSSSKSAIKRLIKWAVDSGKVEYDGQTNRRRYKLLNQ